MNISLETMRGMYEAMLKSRLVEEKLIEMLARGEMLGLVHSTIGQEAIPIGATWHLTDGDYWNAARGHIQSNIVRGMDLKPMFAEFLGKKAGPCGGKGGKVHLCDPSVGNLGFRGCQGAFIPLCCGVAFAQKMKKTGGIAMCFFGDGASNQGTFYEGLNLASLHKLPVVFVCANNQYSVSTRPSEHTPLENIADRAPAFAMPGMVVDGNDVEAVYKVVGEAVERARNGQGPTLIEGKTYRIRGHYEGDPMTYRPQGEVEEWKKRDPLDLFTRRCLDLKVISQDEVQRLREVFQQTIEEAVQFAKDAPYPPAEDLLKDVFMEGA